MKVIDKRKTPLRISFEDLHVGQCFEDPDYEDGFDLFLKYSNTYEDGLDNVWSFVENVSRYYPRNIMVVPVDTEIHIIK